MKTMNTLTRENVTKPIRITSYVVHLKNKRAVIHVANFKEYTEIYETMDGYAMTADIELLYEIDELLLEEYWSGRELFDYYEETGEKRPYYKYDREATIDSIIKYLGDDRRFVDRQFDVIILRMNMDMYRYKIEILRCGEYLYFETLRDSTIIALSPGHFSEIYRRVMALDGFDITINNTFVTIEKEGRKNTILFDVDYFATKIWQTLNYLN